MRFFKSLFKKLKSPNALVVILVIAIFAASLALSILSLLGKIPEAAGYFMYALAAVSLVYIVYLIVTGSKRIKASIIARCEKHKWSNRLLHDYGFRTFVTFIISTVINVAYAVYNGVYGIIFLSVWFGSLSLYYIALSLLRGSIVIKTARIRSKGEAENGEITLRAYRVTGIFLMLLPLALTASVVQMALDGRAFVHAGMLIFVAAAYTFTKITMSIVNIVKTRKTSDYTLYAMRNIGFADSLVSVLALQTAMFAAFSSGEYHGIANGIVGGAVCALTFLLGLYMIIISSLRLKKAKEIENEEQV